MGCNINTKMYEQTQFLRSLKFAAKAGSSVPDKMSSIYLNLKLSVEKISAVKNVNNENCQ
jgi:hypothetical protein